MKQKLKLAALAVFCAACVIAATVVGYQDWQVRATPPTNPGTGYFRTWADNGSGLIKCITSTGANCFFNPPASSGAVTFQTNGTNNGSQSLLNLIAGSNMTITDNGTGGITFASSGGGGSLLLQTNTVNNGSQSLLNLVAGGGMTLTDDGSGDVTIATTAGSTRAIGMAFGMSGGTALSPGATQYVTVPFSCDVKGWNMTVDAGTATVDVWKLAAAPFGWAGSTGTVNTGGTAVTWLSGGTFPANAAGRGIVINSVLYEIATVNSTTSLTLKTSAGAQFGVSYAAPGAAVPTVSNKIDASALPQLTSGTYAGSTSIGTWVNGNTGTHVIKNDIFGFNLNAVSGVSALSIVLECQQ